MRTKLICVLAVVLLAACKKKEQPVAGSGAVTQTEIDGFLKKFPKFQPYAKDITALYEKHASEYVWFEGKDRSYLADVLYNRASQIEREGVPTPLPYEEKIGKLIRDDDKPKPENDLLISGMYFFYAKKVLDGLNPKLTRKLGWFLPRERTSYVSSLDTLMADPGLIKKDESENIGQYYNLRKALQNYRAIEQAGGWQTIVVPQKPLKKGDDSPVIAQVRQRLSKTGEYSGDVQNTVYDARLLAAVNAYRVRQNMKPSGLIDAEFVKALNVPVQTRIKTIVVNMERCRWLTPEYADAKEFISVNIPSYNLIYVRDGKQVLQSNVVVGDEGNKTVIFSGKISYLVFAPYWNVPESIIEKEIKPAMDRDDEYLEKHNMEWNDGHVRQKPGEDNSLGLVKFMFPNSNNIYLHDSPAKSLFNKEDRALSHGCVRVQKARELAIMILDNESDWNAAKVDEAMHAGTETQHPLKRRIPVYIAYFTAWSDAEGNTSFYDDVYNRDNRVAALLYKS